MTVHGSGYFLKEETLADLGLRFEIGFFEKVLAYEPENLEALEALGNAYTRVGRYEDGLRIDQRLVHLLPQNAIVHYNLACSYSLLKQLDKAFEALQMSMDLGYCDFSYMAKDPDLTNLRHDKRYKKLLSQYRESPPC